MRTLSNVSPINTCLIDLDDRSLKNFSIAKTDETALWLFNLDHLADSEGVFVGAVHVASAKPLHLLRTRTAPVCRVR